MLLPAMAYADTSFYEGDYFIRGEAEILAPYVSTSLDISIVVLIGLIILALVMYKSGLFAIGTVVKYWHLILIAIIVIIMFIAFRQL